MGLVVVVCAALAADSSGSTSRDLVKHAIPFVFTPFILWLFFSERYERTLGVFLLYLGLLDGVIKLGTGSSVATLGRDVLLYAITLGAITRLIIRRTKLEIPPFTGFVIAWVAVCLMQVLNPNGQSFVHSLASLRQHLEFVPLFFFGYFVLRSQHRLTGFLILLVVIAAANGIVSLIQSGMSPSELASWGPGYTKLELGTATTVARVFVTATGVSHPRPPGLGGADGFGGLVCLIALPAAAVLFARLRRAVKLSWVLVPGTLLIIAGIVASEERVTVIGAVIVFIAYLALTFTSRRRLGALAGIVLVGLAAFFVSSAFISGNANRYASLSPTHIFSTSTNARGASIALLPTYLARYPLGDGLGSVGPATGLFGGVDRHINGETELNFLVVETGIPGLLVMFAFCVATIRAGLLLRRTLDPELQRTLMALVAVLITFLVIWLDAPVTADSPTAPFLWLGAGCLAFWFRELRAGHIKTRARRVQAKLAMR
jgi:hypothetical protein